MGVHDGEAYLGEAVGSILAQTFADFEMIIVDDGSRDRTPAILADAAARDRRVRILRNDENLGIPRSANRGLSACRGAYVARMDADDIALPHRLARQVAFLDAHPSAVLCSSWFDAIAADGRFLKRVARDGDPDVVAWLLHFYNHVAGNTMAMVRAAALRQIGGYDEALRYAQDYGLWLRLAELGEIHILPEVLIQYRVHDANVTSTRNAEQRRFALSLAQRSLALLLGAPPDEALARALMGFWVWEYPDPRLLPHVEAALEQAFRAFLTQHAGRLARRPEVPARMREAVGRQFLGWAGERWRARDLRTAAEALVLAGRWMGRRAAPHALRAARRRARALLAVRGGPGD
jgi:GT2 family glycosyltransferase